ncbi:hypothetical protein B9G38_12520 [Halorubrum sp. SD612]|nr:hypothetical protein B9G38_12520 [Halorubrum sp. SD612]
MFSADPQSAIYKWAAGTSAVFTADPLAVIYKQVAGALEAFTVEQWLNIFHVSCYLLPYL